MEKRLPIAIVVHLAQAGEHAAQNPEVTYTDNISGHGACVVSVRPWRAGEIAEITSLNDRINLHGKVVYCHRRGEGRYNVGVFFQDREVTWSPPTSYASHHVGIYRDFSASKLVRSA